jgi:sterol desaturase/sphingolipid hydroxylase (fatty acid hydroxylase superfamily)
METTQVAAQSAAPEGSGAVAGGRPATPGTAARPSVPAMAVAVAGYPALLGLCLWISWWFHSTGHGKGEVMIAGLGSAVLLIWLLEVLFPYAPRWQRPVGADIQTDALTYLGNRVLATPLRAGLAYLQAGIAIAGSNLLGSDLWPGEWPFLAQLTLGLVAYEFGHYWYHRLAHETDFLWRFHSVHHSSKRLYWLNATRFHVIDLVALHFCAQFLLIVLGAPASVIILVMMCSGIHGYLQHANVRFEPGPLNWLLSTPALHRYHHSVDVARANHNYGNNLILWDIVFGSRYLPRDMPHDPDDIGIAYPHYPAGYFRQLLAPLRWAQATRR